MNRCEWVTNDPDYIQYHGEEWGRAVHEDRKLFEMLTLEGAQAGLSWLTILKRREAYREAFDHFRPEMICNYGDEKVAELQRNEGIIRNRLKIRSVITNAGNFLKVQQEFGSFDRYIWQFTGGETIRNHWKHSSEIPVATKESDEMSKDLKRRGFKFVGPTICYAFMQAVGMVDDHTENCFLYHNSSSTRGG
ncbi:DNA-3-methyladenine glycosylase I [Virgibacillus xinjiangensis]|uniref:DNA-3-methyladenine glycosylase I n=1 Tax=Virgibacillus xinjiangensis TaxID=393090 RepID=A0ABV7CZB7_9BACI